MSVTLEGAAARLVSDTHDEGALRAIWRSALLNESLFDRAAARRAETLDALVR